jgi:predicted NAD/FAD-dependent oxidoreductase
MHNRHNGREYSEEAWIFHLNPTYSKTHLEKEPDEIIQHLLCTLKEQLPSVPPVVWSHGHRWRYAHFEANPFIDTLSLLDPEQSLGICGDWIVGSSIVKSMQSGLDLANRLIENV